MAEKKVTTMVIKVDLECEKCHRKIKKVLCRIPRDPENVREKIIFKGGEAVKSIEIKVPEKPKPAAPPAEAPERAKTPAPPAKAPEPAKTPAPPAREPSTLKAQPKPTDKPEGPSKPKDPANSKEPEKPVVVIVEPPKHKEPEPAPPPKALEPHALCPPAPAHPRTCSPEYNQWIGGGPCYHGHGRPASPTYAVHGRPVYDSWGGGGGGQRTGYDLWKCEYVYEDNPSSCTIM
ncbi:hypothetical protein DKX38_008879 [Salix brachista]|uniref:HMA domain-containing protein n=1 Tax=Salix brachista TaxID=2182728 RepID=A0A5N5M9F4_9ROSI|nr:hypothetical protein DKX38_008879 [Salix brachista]